MWRGFCCRKFLRIFPRPRFDPLGVGVTKPKWYAEWSSWPSDPSVAAVARDLEISTGSLHRWVRELQQDGAETFRGKGTRTKEEAELAKLRPEVKKLKAEIQFLKKVSTYFAKHPQ